MEPIETISDSNDTDWQDTERFWISYLKFLGCKLTNGDIGGLSGTRHTEETKRKISASSIGRVVTEETRKKISDKNKGQIPWTKGRKHSPETITRMRAAKMGHKVSDESRAKMRDSRIRYVESQRLKHEKII